jgi:hypothetical protein
MTAEKARNAHTPALRAIVNPCITAAKSLRFD